jgi:glutamate formiminotransferase/formiminotetrahydrofolate cyclodeaminase
VDEYNMAQVTVNLNDYEVTPIHVLYEEAKKDAAELNVGVAGSEIVGIVPLDSIIQAAEYYMERENLFILDEDQKVRLAVERLGLNSVAPFNPKEKIIEYIVAEEPDEPLASMTVRDFIEEVGARSSAPGGGSVSAALAAMGSGLAAMAAKLTYGVRKFEHLDADMRRIIPPLHETYQALIPMIDADTTAFNEYMDGLAMPKDTPQQREARQAKMREGLKTAVRVPLQTMALADAAWDSLVEAARLANIACKSDIQVGARSLETGIWGAWQNVLINLPSIRDDAFTADVSAEAEALGRRAKEKCAEVLDILESRSK